MIRLVVGQKSAHHHPSSPGATMLPKLARTGDQYPIKAFRP